MTDANSDTDTITYNITIGTPSVTVSFTTTPTSGEVPLDVALDASASTAGGNELLEEDETIWYIESSDYGSFVDDEGIVHVFGTRYEAKGITANITIEEVDIWAVRCIITQASTGATDALWKPSEIVTRPNLIVNFDAQHGKVTTVGDYTANFEARLNAAAIESWTAIVTGKLA